MVLGTCHEDKHWGPLRSPQIHRSIQGDSALVQRVHAGLSCLSNRGRGRGWRRQWAQKAVSLEEPQRIGDRYALLSYSALPAFLARTKFPSLKEA